MEALEGFCVSEATVRLVIEQVVLEAAVLVSGALQDRRSKVLVSGEDNEEGAIG